MDTIDELIEKVEFKLVDREMIEDEN
jgi:hypothetical protein